ncbi:MAG TPA: N-acetyltransferase [Ruminococcus sp.]|nr:N-acetyltransferase [Ruminococcus sp.]
MDDEMLVDKSFSRKLNEYKDVCRLMRTAFPQNEQIPMWLLRVLAFRKSVNFRAFYDDDLFCGVLYTAEDDKYIFVLYLAVNDRIRSKGYGTKILDWLKQNTEKIIVLNVEAINLSAENALQREKRISFYSRNGIFDTGYRFIDEGETYSVLASDIHHFDLKEYEMLLSRFSLGTYKKHITG